MEISVSRNVLFHEQHFPFHLKNNSKPPAFFLPISTGYTEILYHDLPDIFVIHNTTGSSYSSFQNDQDNNSFHDNMSDLSDTSSSSDQLLRKSTRVTKPPSHLSDYICGTSNSRIPSL